MSKKSSANVKGKRSRDGTTIGLSRKLRRLNQSLASVKETSYLLAGPMELQQVLEIVVRTVAKAIHVDAAGLRLLNKDTDRLVLKATWGLSNDYVKKGAVTAGESMLNALALGGEAIDIKDMRTDPHFIQYHDDIEKEGLVSNLTIGLMYRGEGLGILRLYTRQPRIFSPADIKTAEIVAAQSSAAIVNARLYAEAIDADRINRQMKLAGQVQLHMIPREAPIIEGIEFSGIYVPSYGVGGDFYDFIPLSQERWLVTLGDIMGKGIPASLRMASLRAMIRAFAQSYGSLSDLISAANGLFTAETDVGEFATLFSCEIDIASGTLAYCCSGHEPALLLRDGEVIELEKGGTVIGLDNASLFETETITLQKDDLILLYTDGLADAPDFNGEHFGQKRIIEALKASAYLSAEGAAKNVIWSMRKFAGLNRRSDDTAIVMIKKTN
jgi:sigma-B regulation protein RsbU (phosphoserine phosphatase)